MSCAQFIRETFPEVVESHAAPGEVTLVFATLRVKQLGTSKR